MKNKELHFLSQLSSYTLKSMLIRIASVSGVGLLFFFLSIKITGDVNLHVSVFEYLQVVLIFNIISESNVFIDHLAERFLPIPEKISLRVVLHIVVSLIIAVAAVFYFSLIMRETSFFSYPIVQLMIFLGLIFIFILILVSVTLRIVEKWIFSVRQLEELKSLKLKSDYNSLQAQLNPHFLFNNLSVLKSMITFDPDAAIVFTQNFTDVYRYVLQSKDQTTVKLSDELEFMDAYTALHRERMGEAFQVIKKVGETALKKDIPPLALQLLVENAVKHNIATKDAPLIIHIASNEDSLTVSNNLNLKESAYSEKTGLNNLKQRYALLSDRQVEINHGNDTFEVKIPLL
ncbi:MAG: histidine kinase [Lentimicrobium sp.]|jgi:sensor histidine kinase YesM|nr:histidine kinase [Lentimicrobium sp.]MDD2528845.1 histidine kinase [Lentimicrobiaceae bacterium]MDD4598594.1 histidine kinase [Lentimicrobiaceae bacterium]MDY0026174.1 histidine kinase [Lentimicrobium sp.]